MIRRLLLALFACFALLGVVAGVVMVWQWLTPTIFTPWEKTLFRKELGWKVLPDNRDEIRRMIAGHPLPVIQLLTHDSRRVRAWAKGVLSYDVANGMSDQLLDLISAELGENDSAYDKPDLIELLADAKERGVQRLMRFYRSNNAVNPALHLKICSLVSLPGSQGELKDALLAVAKDDTVTLENRRLAVEALGHMSQVPPYFGKGELEESAIAKLTALLPNLPEPVAAAARVALHRIEQRDWWYSQTTRYRPGNGYVVSPSIDGGADAIAALSDKTDLIRVGFAAEELTRHEIHAAIPELERVAATYWYPPVRQTAEQAVRILRGQEPPLPPAVTGLRPITMITKHEGAAIDAWYKTHPGPTPSPVLDEVRGLLNAADWKLKPAKNAVLTRLQPEFDRVVFEEPGRLPIIRDREDFEMNPTRAISFAGGKLLGGDVSESGGGTVFHRKGEIARYFPTANVEAFVRTTFGVLIFCSPSDLSYLATEQSNGRVSVDFFLRLPRGAGQPNELPSGEILIPCEVGDLIISTNGEVRMVERTAK